MLTDMKGGMLSGYYVNSSKSICPDKLKQTSELILHNNNQSYFMRFFLYKTGWYYVDLGKGEGVYEFLIDVHENFQSELEDHDLESNTRKCKYRHIGFGE